MAVAQDRALTRPVASGRESGRDLQLGLDFPLPRTLAVGTGTALFVCGWCFSPQARVRSLAFVVDGEVQPVMHHGMPRIDVLRAVASGPQLDEDSKFRSYWSGFWGIARVAPRAGDRACELLMRATLHDGGEELVELARIPTTRRAEQEVPLPEPDPAHWQEQLREWLQNIKPEDFEKFNKT